MTDTLIPTRRLGGEPSHSEEHETQFKNQPCGCEQSKAGGDCSDAASREPPPRNFVAENCGPDGQPLDDTASASYPLATVALSNGAKIEFEAVEEQRGQFGVAMRELGHAERMMPSVLGMMAQRSAPDIYAALCPGKPVPKVVAALSKKTAKQDLVDAVHEPIEADLDELGIQPDVALGSSSGGGYGGQFCVSGAGWHAFRDFACFGSYPSNAWRWCDPDVSYYWRDRWTINQKRRNSFGITATCGGPAETRHYRQRNNGRWTRMKTWYLPTSHWQWTRYEGNFKYDRWVAHVSSIQGGPSFVRSATAIYN